MPKSIERFFRRESFDATLGIRNVAIYRGGEQLLNIQRGDDWRWTIISSHDSDLLAYVTELFVLRPVLHANEACPTMRVRPFGISAELLITMLSDGSRWCERCAPAEVD